MFDYVREGHQGISPGAPKFFPVISIGALTKVSLVEPIAVVKSATMTSEDKGPKSADLLSFIGRLEHALELSVEDYDQAWDNLPLTQIMSCNTIITQKNVPEEMIVDSSQGGMSAVTNISYLPMQTPRKVITVATLESNKVQLTESEEQQKKIHFEALSHP